MKMLHAIAAARAALAAVPAQAQERPLVADTYDQGDWWWIDVTGGAARTLLLVDGEGVRRGDTVEMKPFLAYREPSADGALGSRVESVLNCKTLVETATFGADFYPEMRMKLPASIVQRDKTLTESSVYYQFVCLGDRSRATHFGPGSRRAIAASLFAKYPAPR